jgi:hypothetical protein
MDPLALSYGMGVDSTAALRGFGVCLGLPFDACLVYRSRMSNSFQHQFNHVIDRFVADISALARRAAIDSLQVTLNKRAGTGTAFSHGKRGTSELEELGDRFVKFVADNPGLRIEQINKQLGTTTKDLALPIRKLIAEGALKAKGTKRSTTYFASEGRKKKN